MKFSSALLLCAVSFYSCKQKVEPLPSISTYTVSNITSNSASSGGIITGENITQKGLCWSLTAAPNIDGPNTAEGGGPEHFESQMTELLPLTTYYVRAYAINSAGIAYGELRTFKTKNPPTLPIIKTSPVTNISSTSVVSGGSVSVAGEASVTACGLCWNTNPTPTIDNEKTAETPISGTSFSRSITGLSPGTQYYLRAYVKAAGSVVYGDQYTFKTFYGSLADYDGNTYNTIVINGKEWMAENLRVKHYANGDQILNLVDNLQWANFSTGAYGIYNTTLPEYGNLYNFYAVADSRRLAPTGWHVATQNEWTELIAHLGGATVASIKARSAGLYWGNNSPYIATNESSFSALPGGYRSNDGYYALFSQSAWFWTANTAVADPNSGINIYLDHYNFYPGANPTRYGYSVRCVKD